MLTPGSYLRLRRQAAGHTVQSAAAELAALPIAVGGTQPSRAAILEAILLRVEGNLAFLRAAESRIVTQAFHFDPKVYEELAMIHEAGPGHNLRVPQVCHGCGCSYFDPCMSEGMPCDWSAHDATMCTACDANATGARHLHPAHQPQPQPAGREVVS